MRAGNCAYSQDRQATTAKTTTFISDSALAILGRDPEVLATEHVLQYRHSTSHWPDHTSQVRKLYGSVEDLQSTSTLITEPAFSI